MLEQSELIVSNGIIINVWAWYWQFILFLVFLGLAIYLVRLPFQYIWQRGFDPQRRAARYLKVIRSLLFLAGVFVAAAAIYQYSEFLGHVSVTVVIAVCLISQVVNLRNLFAGFILMTQKPFRVGQRIRIQSHEGTVVGIKLFSVILRNERDEIVRIPNADLLAQSYDVSPGVHGFPVVCQVPITGSQLQAFAMLRQLVTICPLRASNSPIEVTPLPAAADTVQAKFFTWSPLLVDHARDYILLQMSRNQADS